MTARGACRRLLWSTLPWLAPGLTLLLAPSPAGAHCDTLDGPVVKDARAALTAGDVSPVLKWVGEDEEDEVRDAFRHALSVRALGPEARVLADRFFFETVVRVHRQGEGALYTGLKPAGTPMDPAVAKADKALDTGDVESLVRAVAAAAEHGLRSRFARAAEARHHAGDSVEEGRAYVAAYVDFAHHAERLLQSAAAPVAAHGAAPARANALAHAH
jgi:hypothetical protein